MEFALGLVSLLLVLTNVFWLWQYNKLINKFMSRNYAEYVQASNTGLDRAQVKEELPQPTAYEEHRSRELNQMFGMV